jgi:hypothetical protein
MYNLTLNDEAALLSSRADLHFAVLAVNDTPSSAIASLYSIGSKKSCACNLSTDHLEDHSAFAGASSLFLSKTALKTNRQYVFVLNGTEPRQSYWIVAHGTALRCCQMSYVLTTRQLRPV